MLAVGGLVLAAALVAADPAFDDRPVDEDTVKHVGTGVAAGMATMGTCTTYFVLRGRVKQKKSLFTTGGCYAVTVGLAGVAYGVKEGLYDPEVHGDGKMSGRGRRDFTEGFGGSALGALVFVPIARW